MREEIAAMLQGMSEQELAHIARMIAAKRQSEGLRPLAFLLGLMQFAPVGGDGYVYEMVISEELQNRYGIVHGGVITTFIDTAMAETAFVLDGALQKAVTLHLTVNFVKAGVDGKLRCTIVPTQNSYRVALFSATVTDDGGDVVATANGHFYKTAHQTSAP